ncbi:hypothetical protein ABH943_008306 [Caballeronia udeis]|uniref:Uncharacterized protein n=1 Tax=Caballeronia udeis TaxID=1232866 RepID=A0ABW8MY12_9BURK
MFMGIAPYSAKPATGLVLNAERRRESLILLRQANYPKVTRADSSG